MSETTPEDHLIILCEFPAGNKAHATSSSIRAQVNYSRVRVNCSRVSVKLHLSCTICKNCIIISCLAMRRIFCSLLSAIIKRVVLVVAAVCNTCKDISCRSLLHVGSQKISFPQNYSHILNHW